jgi:hypothetical protein
MLSFMWHDTGMEFGRRAISSTSSRLEGGLFIRGGGRGRPRCRWSRPKASPEAARALRRAASPKRAPSDDPPPRSAPHPTRKLPPAHVHLVVHVEAAHVAPVALDHVDQVVHAGVLLEQELGGGGGWSVGRGGGGGLGRHRGRRVRCTARGTSRAPARAPAVSRQPPAARAPAARHSAPAARAPTPHLAVVDLVLLQDARHQLVVHLGHRARAVDRHAAGLALAEVDVGRRASCLMFHVWWGGVGVGWVLRWGGWLAAVDVGGRPAGFMFNGEGGRVGWGG